MLNAEFGTIHRQKREANHGKSGKATARAGARSDLVHGDKLCNQVRGYADYALFHPSARRSRLRNIFAVYERAGGAVGGGGGAAFTPEVNKAGGAAKQKITATKVTDTTAKVKAKKSNLNDAYRKKVKKLREETRSIK